MPHAPVLSLAEVVDDPQARHIGLEQRATHPVEGEVRGIRNPIGFAGAPEGFDPPPMLGEDSDRLRDWLADSGDQRTKPK